MIEIVLPVYNGETYLSSQLDSILGQTYENWILKIRNDGSKDNSQAIIDSYCKKYPQKIINIVSPSQNVGLIQSLNYLLAAEPHGDYISFSDQDDIWLPNKLEISYKHIKELEKLNPEVPLGICTDVKCVDAKLNILSESFFKSQKFLDNIIGNTNKMLALNVVQGCSVLTNKLAKDKYYPFPDILNVHDMWLAVIISYYGKMCYLRQQTMLYRQHEENVLGEINVGFNYYLNRFRFAYKTIGNLRKIQKCLNIRSNIIKILYYKFFFALNRIFK